MVKKRRRRIYQVKRKSLFKNRYFWFIVIFLMIVLSIFYFLIFFDKFQVKEIRISGNEKILTNELENIIFKEINREILFFNSRTILLINKDQLKNKILKKYPTIEKLNIKKDFPNRLILEVKERKKAAVFCDQGCFSIDENGVIFEVHDNLIEQEMIIRSSESSTEELGREIIKKDFIDLALKIEKNMKENLQIMAKELIFESPARLNVKTAEDWQIYFSLESNIDLQITKLNLLLKKEIPFENWGNLDYIDLRFNKAFYKFKS